MESENFVDQSHLLLYLRRARALFISTVLYRIEPQQAKISKTGPKKSALLVTSERPSCVISKERNVLVFSSFVNTSQESKPARYLSPDAGTLEIP